VRERVAGKSDALGGARWVRTVGTVAPMQVVTYPELSSAVPAPALDGRVVLRKEATEDH